VATVLTSASHPMHHLNRDGGTPGDELPGSEILLNFVALEAVARRYLSFAKGPVREALKKSEKQSGKVDNFQNGVQESIREL
jgi:hypothetical protein